MEEIDLKELLKYFMKKLPVVFLSIILALLLGYAYIEYFQVPMYKGTTTIILVENSENRVSNLITQNEISVNEKLVATYSEVIKSKRVLNRVIEELSLKTTIEELIEVIEVSSVENTAIIEISVSHNNGNKAAEISNKIAEVFEEEIVQIYNLENVSIIDEAFAEEEPYNVNIPLQFLIYTAIGMALSVGIIFIMFYFNNSISTKQEIESNLNIPVLGEVPTTHVSITKKHKLKKKIKAFFEKKDKQINNFNKKNSESLDTKSINKEPKKTSQTKKAKHVSQKIDSDNIKSDNIKKERISNKKQSSTKKVSKTKSKKKKESE